MSIHIVTTNIRLYLIMYLEFRVVNPLDNFPG